MRPSERWWDLFERWLWVLIAVLLAALFGAQLKNWN